MVYFILNPTAGSGKALNKLKEIETHMTGKYRILMTNSPMDAKYLTREAIEQNAEAVVAVGGDGTIHETISGLVGSDIPLGIIPAGSGNDFIKSIGLSQKLSTAKYLEIIKARHIKAIDLIQMGNFYFANIGSIGIDASIVYMAAGLKKTFGGAAYLVSTLRNVVSYKAISMGLKIDGSETRGEYTLVAICNGNEYGGGFKIAPSAKNDDGLITLCLIDKMSHPEMTTLFPFVMAGKHEKLKQAHFINCKEVTLNYGGTQKLNLDGNIYDLQSPLEFKALPGALNILI